MKPQASFFQDCSFIRPSMLLSNFLFINWIFLKLLLALDRFIAIPVNLNFFLICVRTIVLRFFGAFQVVMLLNLPNSAITILYHSSIAVSFHSCDDTMAILSLSSIAPYAHLPDFYLIMAKCLWKTGSIWPVDCEFDPLAKYRFALVCRFRYFLEFYLYI